ncbi:16S rRNA processing protein RimM [Proteiniborus ethanoligenes]|uniref:Ribosome maturation factor RimM n=1 Tax=Proteiniborus ethanoligenes TaxID=415015 RepID=A0A1H3PN43_9FIRM|nr:ribosome maturation factor RimM [Proteiniborus ethanoligenes]TAH59572.1 MAG: ribosome maturation factor RimM [Gottschalkiaceae bacterium]SDZ02361.1 16S rRNA processing protein RimM [Proteiniborus ethanoligenes]
MKHIRIGKIVNTHGINGDVKVLPLTDDSKRFEKLDSIFIEDNKVSVQIERVWYSKGFVMLKFKGYDNINDVLKYKDKYIVIDEKNAVELPEDSYFIFQIIGIKVYCSDGRELGEIIEVLQPGGNDVYVVQDIDKKTGDKKEYLIPAIKDVVKKIDIDNKEMIIEPIKGLIE